MSDNETTEVTSEVTETTEPKPSETLEYWKDYARKHEDRAKANKKELDAANEAARKWEEYQASQKTESEKLAERLAAAEKAAEESRSSLLKYEIAAELGLPQKALALLKGTTKEELTENAQVILELIGSKSDEVVVDDFSPKAPKPLRTQGVVAGASPKSPEELFAEKMNRLR